MQKGRYRTVDWGARTLTAACLATLLACGGSSRAAKTPASATSSSASPSETDRVPLTKAEEQWIVELTHKLASDEQPAASEVNEAARRISAAPGILVPICANVLGPLIEEGADFDLTSRFLVASAGALLETPALSADLIGMTTSSLVAVSQAYRAYRAKTGTKVGPLEMLEAQERDGELASWVRANWSTCPQSIAVVRAMEDQGDNTVNIGPDASASSGERPWGEPVPDGEQEAKALAMMQSIGTGTADVAILSETLVLGPGAYRTLLGVDKESGRDDIASTGTPSTSVVSSGDKVVSMPMRSYLDVSAREALLQALAFRGLSDALGRGQSRPATEAERKFWYALIPFEIKGKPVTIIELEGNVVVVFIKDGTINWMDILSAYAP